MGIFDAIFGLGSSDHTDAAAAAASALISGANSSGNNALRQTTTKANDALTANTNLGLGALDKGYGSAIAALGDYGKQAQGLLQGGVKDATGTVLGGNAAYQPYLTSGQNANALYGDALGLNGPAGHDAATAAFQASPGYQFQQSQAADATARKAASLGLAGSGSTLDALLNQSSRLANTEYSNWLTNLQSLGGQGLNATNAVSANNQTAGGYQAAGGTAGAQLAQNTGQNIANAHVGQGTGEAGLYGNLGSGLSSNYVNLGRGISSNDLTSAQLQAGVTMQQGQADDTAANTDNSVLSKLIGGVTGLPFGGSSLSGSTGGFNISPSSGGGFSLSPTSSASSSGGGFFGPLFSNAGKSIANVVNF